MYVKKVFMGEIGIKLILFSKLNLEKTFRVNQNF